MNNFEEKDEKEEEISTQTVEIDENFNPDSLLNPGQNIDFSENFDLDKIQQSILAAAEDNDSGEKTEENSIDNNPENRYKDFISTKNFLDEKPIESFSKEMEDIDSLKNKAKKFVVHILPKNIEFFTSLSLEARNELINTAIIRKQQESTKNNLKKIMIHFLIIFLTVVIFLPICFFIANLSVKSTTKSYKEVQNSFETLYKTKGGVKHKNLKNLKNVNF